MKPAKKRPKSFKRLDGDPSFLIKRFIRTKSDAELVCDWLIENADNCSKFRPGVFLGLHDAVATWETDTSMWWHPQFGRIAEMVAEDLKGLTVKDVILNYPAVEGILTMFRAFKCAFKRQSYANVERRNSASGLTAAVGVQTNGNSTKSPQNKHATDLFAPTVVWKYEDERLEAPFADGYLRDFEVEINEVWANLPKEIKAVLSCFDIQISVVDMLEELACHNPPMEAPDDCGGVTINVEFYGSFNFYDGLAMICATVVKQFAVGGTVEQYNASMHYPKIRQDKPLSDVQLEEAIKEIVDKGLLTKAINAASMDEFHDMHVDIDLDDSAEQVSGTLEGRSNME